MIMYQQQDTVALIRVYSLPFDAKLRKPTALASGNSEISVGDAVGLSESGNMASEGEDEGVGVDTSVGANVGTSVTTSDIGDGAAVGLTVGALLGSIVGARGEDELVAVGDTVGWLDGPVGTNVGIAVTKSDDGDGAAVG